MNNIAQITVVVVAVFTIAFMLDYISRNKQTFLKTFKSLLKPMKKILAIIALLFLLMLALSSCKKETIIIIQQPCAQKAISQDSIQKWFNHTKIMK